MKKLFALILAIAMLALLCACGNTDMPAGETTASSEIKSDLTTIQKYVEMGYERGPSIRDELEYRALYSRGETFVCVCADMTMADYEALEALDFFDEEYNEKYDAIINALTIKWEKDITYLVPTQDELDALVGKTLGEIEDAGFEQTGYFGSDDGYEFYYSNNIYDCLIKITTKIVDPDDYSVNAMRAMVISAVEYQGLSSNVIDNIEM